MKCDECNNANICLDHIKLPSLNGCTSGIPDHKIATNADRIRSMSDDELAEIISEWDSSMGKEEWLDWLQSPVDEVSDMENLEARR